MSGSSANSLAARASAAYVDDDYESAVELYSQVSVSTLLKRAALQLVVSLVTLTAMLARLFFPGILQSGPSHICSAYYNMALFCLPVRLTVL